MSSSSTYLQANKQCTNYVIHKKYVSCHVHVQNINRHYVSAIIRAKCEGFKDLKHHGEGRELAHDIRVSCEHFIGLSVLEAIHTESGSAQRQRHVFRNRNIFCILKIDHYKGN